MSVINIRTWLLALTFGLALVAGTASATLARPNNQQSGLVNVNVQDLVLQVPLSVAVPVGVALNACNISVIELEEQGGTDCRAESNSFGLSRSIADTMLGMGGNGGARNNQSGLVNVNLQDITIQIPASVAVPIGVAANICNLSVIEVRETGATGCAAVADVESRAFSVALARALSS